MSAATLDIERPPENLAQADRPSTDDLVAQQASEDINKLLEEANVERPGTEPLPPAHVEAEPATVAPTAAGGGGADDETLRVAHAGAGPALDAKPPGEATAAHPGSSSHPPTETPGHAAANGSGAAANKPDAGSHSGSADHAHPDINELDDARTCDPLPAYLRPLEWLNQPFAGISETSRQLLGFAAIITLVNALATIVYVLRFRHHH